VNRESIPGFGDGDGAEDAVAVPRCVSRALDVPCAWLAWAVPLLVGIGSASAEPSWADDVGVLRDLGFARVGIEGVVSTLLTQLAALAPVGGRFLRASLVGVLALAVASRLAFDAIRALLDRRGPAPIHPLLALFASSLWALGPMSLGEATHAGGALVAVALVLLVLRLLPAAFEHGDARALVATGLAAGASLAECHVAGLSGAMLVAGTALAWREGAWSRRAGALVASLLFAFALLASLRWGWPASAPVFPALDASPVTTNLETSFDAAGGSALERAGASLARGLSDLGVLPLALAGVGVVLAACGAHTVRRAFIPWLLAVACAPVAALASSSAVAHAFGASLSSLAVAAFFPIALARAVAALWASRLPFGRPAAVLIVTFASTLVLSRADRVLLERASPRAVEAWTEAALGGLPPQSLVLVQSPALARRLFASRVLHDTRPDVVVVPSPFITTGSSGFELSRTEPSAAPLLRQLWVNGSADEYSLSRLADERAVFVELDRAWDRRMLEHLRPDGLWLSFSAHALGASERRAAATRARAGATARVELAGGDAALDPATRRALGDALGGQALALAALAEREPASQLLAAARRIDRNSPRVRETRLLLSEGVRGRVAAGGRME